MRLNSIQFLRGIAALVVVIYHIRALELDAIKAFGGGESPFVAGPWQNGYAGVDLFFVISGFIMVYVVGRAPAGPTHSASFLFARAVRIYPLWWLFMVLLGVYFFITYGHPYDAEDLALRGVDPTWHLIASTVLLPQNDFPLLGVGWTLVHEMHFYIVFALLLLLPSRYRVWAVGVWAMLVIAGALAGQTSALPRDYIELFFSPLSLEFIAGAAAAYLIVNGYRWRPALVATIGTTAFIAAMALHRIDPEFTLIWGRVLLFGLPGAMMVYGLVCLDIAGRLKLPASLVTLGDWSYALYLSHMLTLSALKRIMPVAADYAETALGVPTAYANLLRTGAASYGDNIIFVTFGLTASIIVAWLSFRLIERPVLGLASDWRRRWFARSRATMQPAPIRAAVW